MVIAVIILVFLVLGLGFACVNLFAYWKKANKERDEAQKAQKEWEVFGLATKEENEALAEYKPIADIEAHIAKLEGEAGARLASVNEETATKEAVLREAEAKAMAEVQARIEEAERDSKSRLVTMTSQLVEKEARLKEAQDLLTATRNIVEGYGNEYLVPKEALFDQLAAEYGHEKAGQKLKEFRDIGRTMIRKGYAASSRIGDKEQNEAAKDFIVDAFNGRVEGILAKAKRLTENYGVLRQQIIDSFNVVNESGRYVGTEITKQFLEVRLEELKWAMKVQELIEEEKEEQRILKERLRDETLARREAEKKAQEQKRAAEEAEEEAKKRQQSEQEIQRKVEELAEKIRTEADAVARAKIEEEKERLQEKVDDEREKRIKAEQEAEELREKYRRDPLDPRGKIYIISNVGSFGEHVYKIGLTRREIEERIKELGDASVPFEFDVHAIIKTDNAPGLESKLHEKLAIYRVNKSNWRKEFFKITIEELKQLIEKEGHETSWTMKAKALQYRETMEIERRMGEDNEFRKAWLNRQAKLELWAETPN
jgi:hypothetical protein